MSEGFEIALIEELGLEALAGDKLSMHDVAKRFYHRGVRDAQQQQPKPLRDLIAEGHVAFWVYTKSFGECVMTADSDGNIYCGGQRYEKPYCYDCAAIPISKPEAPK